MTGGAKGVLAMCAAASVWGLSPLFYALLRDIPALEVLCYRALWSLIFFATVLLVQRQFRAVVHGIGFGQIALAAAMISVNWFGYIFAIGRGHGVEASLGYFIFPLVAVLLGRVFFAERLARLQWIAVGLAGLAVAVLTYGLGVPPWLALMLASTFGAYVLLKKRLALGPIVSVTAEVVVLAPLALGWLLWHGTVSPADVSTHVLLALSGPMTATPLILFSYAARRVSLATVGLLQYINPTLQFGCAVLVFAEPFTPWHAVAFPAIWAALALYSVSLWVQDKAARNAASNASTSATVAI
jgi:chloramphenicol-sensitive protein RarD